MNKYLAVYGKPRYLGIISCTEQLAVGEQVVAESVRGEDIAIIAGLLNDEQEAKYREIKNTVERGDAAPKSTEPAVTDLKFIKIAGEKELNEQALFRKDETEILKKTKELVVPHDLDIKLIDVELLRGKQKLFVYFSSEQRVDFRAYVRDLAKEFKTRIELRQIGVRDEAKIVGGIGMCGHCCCCNYWLHQFVPVGIKMVKEQNLALNPTKISGICGRLMCCMCYEHNVYSEMWEGLPAPGSKIKAGEGNITVIGIDIGAKAVKCFIPGLGEKPVAIAKFEEFRKAAEEGKSAAEFENLIKEKDAGYLPDDFDMNEIFKEKNDSKSENDKLSENRGHAGRRNKVKRNDNNHKHPEDGLTEDYTVAENQDNAGAEEKSEKKHFRYHRRGGKKHRGRPSCNGREA